MSNTNTGGPAFPIQGHSTRNKQGFQLVMADGMNLRDYFAAKAMQTYMMEEYWNRETFKAAAMSSYEIADAMLKARES
jgi:hypothetical protein